MYTYKTQRMIQFWNTMCTENEAATREARPTTTPESTAPSATLNYTCVGSWTSPAIHVARKMQETGPTVSSAYLRRLARVTINNK